MLCLLHYRFLDCGLDIANYTINIVMEHISGGTIASLLKKFGTFDESVFRRYTSQIVDAVTYLHSNNVIHRDIKGSNMMVTSTGFIKLIDFGTAKKTTEDLITPLSAMKLDFCIKGTPYWMAPEVVQMAGDPTDKADIWSIGCTVIEMATGSPPYFHMQPMSALFVIGSMEKPSPKLPEEFSEDARDFVDQCLIKASLKRPSAAKLGSHPFMMKEYIKKYPDNRGFYI